MLLLPKDWQAEIRPILAMADQNIQSASDLSMESVTRLMNAIELLVAHFSEPVPEKNVEKDSSVNPEEKWKLVV